jgi:hypothetical protein
MVTSSPSRDGSFVNALIGAVATVVLSFVPFSPALGGAVAGYLQGEDRNLGLRVGALSGLIATIPVALLVGLFVAVFGVFAVVPGNGTGGAARTLVGLLVLLGLVLLVVAVYTVGLSALGGYVGAILAERRSERRNARDAGRTDDAVATTETDSTI